jgi:hypothetical protein
LNLGELFLNLGVKGSEKTIGALDNVQKGLKDTSSNALAAKAAILGAFYALQRLMSASGQRGTDLTNFNEVVGVSAKTLQQYEYAARQVGVANEEVQGTFKSIQDTMTKTLLGEGAPKGLARVAMLTGGITPEDLQRFAKRPQDLIQKLQEYAQKETDKGLRSDVLKGFGVSDKMIAALGRKAFTPEMLQKAPTYSDKEIGELDKANAAWSNLGNAIEMSIGKFNAKHGVELVEGISKIVEKVVQLAEAFERIASSIKLFEVVGKIFEGWTHIFNGATAAVDAIGGAISDPEKLKKLNKKTVEFVTQDVPAMGKEAMGLNNPLPPKKGPDGKPIEQKRSAMPMLPSLQGTMPKTLAPSVPSAAQAARPTPTAVNVKAPVQQNTTINQNLNFQHDGKDAVKTGASVKKAIKDAYKQSPAQMQGN